MLLTPLGSNLGDIKHAKTRTQSTIVFLVIVREDESKWVYIKVKHEFQQIACAFVVPLGAFADQGWMVLNVLGKA